MYNEFISQPVLSYGLYGLYINIDRGLIEKSGPAGSVSAVRNFSKEINSLQSGDIKHYLMLFTIFGFGFVALTLVTNSFLTFACATSLIYSLDES
jgi:hypothetical protein